MHIVAILYLWLWGGQVKHLSLQTAVTFLIKVKIQFQEDLCGGARMFMCFSAVWMLFMLLIRSLI
jgi:hypothetical protein